MADSRRKDYPVLPKVWIENEELGGVQTFGSLRAAWQRAERFKARDRAEASVPLEPD